MKKINLNTTHKRLLADIYTPVGIYLRLRDRFRDTILLESTDFHTAENSYSFIAINAIAGIEVKNAKEIEVKMPGLPAEKLEIKTAKVPEMLWEFMQRFDVEPAARPVSNAQGLFGYTSFEAVQLFESLTPRIKADSLSSIPMIRYRLYQYVIIIDHFKDELYICENHLAGIESEMDMVESLIMRKDVPAYPFSIRGAETCNNTDDEFLEMVRKGIAHCKRGDVFQVVLSRRFKQDFNGDEFQVYRCLRSINPGPYLFYFDYGDYKLMGSSPESQLIIEKNKAVVHPIAGTFRRTGDDSLDLELAEKLTQDEKENAEHVMLVDLARNDLSRTCSNVQVSAFGKIRYYSHVIHLVSEVTGSVEPGTNPFKVLAATYPAGTLSGAPKFRALQIIDELESGARGYYGGCIGFVGFNGSFNHAIMIRSFLSRNNALLYQAGAGIVAVSNPESELQEVNNKLKALKLAVERAAV